MCGSMVRKWAYLAVYGVVFTVCIVIGDASGAVYVSKVRIGFTGIFEVIYYPALVILHLLYSVGLVVSAVGERYDLAYGHSVTVALGEVLHRDVRSSARAYGFSP